MNLNTYFSTVKRWLGFGAHTQRSGDQESGPGMMSSARKATADVALSRGSVFGAVRILAEAVAGIPLLMEAFKDRQWVPIDDPTDELMMLLQVAPNPHMTHIDMWEAMLLDLVLRGNGYILIVRNDMGMPISLWPLGAGQTTLKIMKDGTGWYLYSYDGTQILYGEDDVMHFRLFGNGRMGLSPLDYGGEAMGAAASADQYAGTFFEKGGKPGGVLMVDRVLTPVQRQEIRESFKRVQEDVSTSHSLAVLEAGMKYEQTQLAPEALQLQDIRKYNVKECLRFLGVPAFLLNESEGSTSWGSGLEQQIIGFRQFTIKPLTDRIAATLRVKLLPLAKRRKTRFKHDLESLVAADLKTLADFYTKLTNGGLLTTNQALGALGWPKSTDKNADKLRVQGAMIPLGNMGEKPVTTSDKLPALNSNTPGGENDD